MAISIGSDPTCLERWNWVQLKSRSNSTHIILAYQFAKSRDVVGIVFAEREGCLKKCNKAGCLRQ